mgnify:CR=1 FL=1
MVKQYKYKLLNKRGKTKKHKKGKKHRQYRNKTMRNSTVAGTTSHCVKYRENPVKCNTTPGCVYSAKNKQCKIKTNPTRKSGQTEQQYNSYAESLLNKARDKNRSQYNSSYIPSAALLVQRRSRGHLARKRLSRLHTAATKIQRKTRKTLTKTSARLNTAATKIQRATRQRNRNKMIQVTVRSSDGKDSIYKIAKSKLILDIKKKLSETTEISIFNINLLIATSEQPVMNNTPLSELLNATNATNNLELFLIVSDTSSEQNYVIDILKQYIPNFSDDFYYGHKHMDIHNPDLQLVESIAYYPIWDAIQDTYPEEIREEQHSLDIQAEYTYAVPMPAPPHYLQNDYVKVKCRDLDINRYNSTLLSEFLIFKNLQEIDIKFGLISYIPPAIDRLQNLTILGLSNNLIRDVPKEICNLTNLLALRLANNCISELPSNIGNLSKLINLDLADNMLTTLPNSFTRLTNIVTLYLNRNKLVDIENCKNMNKLDTVDISHNQITRIPDFVYTLLELVMLNAYQNNITSFMEGITTELMFLPSGVFRLTEFVNLERNPLNAVSQNNYRRLREVLQRREDDAWEQIDY